MNSVDELREKAKLLRAYADGLNAPYVVPSTKELMALTMLDSASRMEQAAYTIESLREKAQDNITERDEVYNAGFDNGVKACLQILEGYLAYPHSAAENIQKWVDEQWEEYES